MTLCVTDTRGSHSELTSEFAAIRQEMEQVAACFGKPLLGQVEENAFWMALPVLRSCCGDRAVLRAIHYFEENAARWRSGMRFMQSSSGVCRSGEAERTGFLCAVSECVLHSGCAASGTVHSAGSEPEHSAGQ